MCVMMKTELKEDQKRSTGWIPIPSKLRDGESINDQSINEPINEAPG